MPEKSDKKPIKRILIIVASTAFLGTLIFPVVEMFSNSSQPSTNADNPEKAALNKQLQEKAEQYETVLKREPDNPTALTELAKARLQMEDYQGAINPLEKLYKLYPDEPVVLQALVDVQIKTNNIKGAIEPMEKLVKLYPEQQEYKDVLAVIKQQASQENQPAKSEK
jgi:predicted Zn-dependent protease